MATQKDSLCNHIDVVMGIGKHKGDGGVSSCQAEEMVAPWGPL